MEKQKGKGMFKVRAGENGWFITGWEPADEDIMGQGHETLDILVYNCFVDYGVLSKYGLGKDTDLPAERILSFLKKEKFEVAHRISLDHPGTAWGRIK